MSTRCAMKMTFQSRVLQLMNRLPCRSGATFKCHRAAGPEHTQRRLRQLDMIVILQSRFLPTSLSVLALRTACVTTPLQSLPGTYDVVTSCSVTPCVDGSQFCLVRCIRMTLGMTQLSVVSPTVRHWASFLPLTLLHLPRLLYLPSLFVMDALSNRSGHRHGAVLC